MSSENVYKSRMQPEFIYKAIGERVKARRRTLGWTQEQLAPRLGMSRASLANIETGRQTVLVHQLYRFAEALEMSPADLLPMPQGAAVASTATELPLPDDLNPQQRRQIAKLFG
jgi:transcriptional regulator with XRE-family HTH domain